MNTRLLITGLLLVLFVNAVNCQTDANIHFKGICIYIDYPDVPAAVTPSQLDGLINGMDYQEEGVERSFRKYWYEQSRRNVDIEHDIFFYRAPETAEYYKSLSWQEGILLWKDALEWIISNNPDYDFRLLDRVDPESGRWGAGTLLSAMVISSEWGCAGVGASHGPRWTLSNGTKIGSIYGSVLKAPWDSANNIFMTLHESGHGVFKFPDTYDTGNTSGGTSFYTLMSGGKPDVEPIGGPFQAEYNWGYVLEPPSGTQTITLRADGDSVVVVRNKYDPLEYFTIEARKRSTIGNSLFPKDLGLLIWHTDTKVPTSNTLPDRTPMRHYRNSIEQADGLFELERWRARGGNAGDIYVPGKTFSNSTRPNTKWWDGIASNLEVTDIQFIGAEYVSFTVRITDPLTERLPEIPQSDWRLVSSTPSQNGYDGYKAFDGDTETYYHVPWANTFSRPHDIIIDLGKEYSINEFFYTANTNYSAPWEGRIEDYKIFISEDQADWGTEVVSGKFFKTAVRQYVLFPNKTGRYLKFSAVNSFNNDVRTSIAEINLRGTDSIPSSLDQIDYDKASFRIFPNPATDILNVQSSSEKEVIVEIYNLDGRLLKSKKMIQAASFNLSDLSKGLYLIKVREAETVRVFKFVKS